MDVVSLVVVVKGVVMFDVVAVAAVVVVVVVSCLGCGGWCS